MTVFDAGETPVSWDDYKKQKPKEYKVCVWCSRVLRLLPPLRTGRGKIKPAALRLFGDLVSPLVIELQKCARAVRSSPPASVIHAGQGAECMFPN